jgi:DNA-binding CsgD family transcriptional regulator
VPIYLGVFHNKRDRELPGSSYADAMRPQIGVHDLASAFRVDRATFARSDLYNLIYRRLGYAQDFLRLVFREGGRGRGTLTLYRSPGTRPWSAEDKRRLAALESFFVHALAKHDDSQVALVASRRSGLIIASHDGKLLHFSAEARRLLFLARHPRIAPGTAFNGKATLPAPLARLCRDLDRLFRDDEAALAPVYHHRNVWGGFTFRAHRLEGSDGASGLVGIAVSHEEPLPVRLVHSVEHLPLSRRQGEVCVLMATGASKEMIAERLHISKHTVNAHGRWIYEKLDVHSRSELTSKLLSN